MIWFTPICSEEEMEAQYLSWLPSLPPERQKIVLRYRNRQDRWLCAAAHMLLAYALRKEYDLTLHDCMIGKTCYGKPYFINYPHICFNISHCSAGVACIISNMPVGIDIETTRIPNDCIIKRVLSEQELRMLVQNENIGVAFSTMWTLKESWVKALGYGLNYSLTSIVVNVLDNGAYYICQSGYKAYTLICNDSYTISACWPLGAERKVMINKAAIC